MFGSRRTHHTSTTERTTHHRSRWGRPSRDRQAAGYKVSLKNDVFAHLKPVANPTYQAAMNNPNTTSQGRRHAKHELQAMVSTARLLC